MVAIEPNWLNQRLLRQAAHLLLAWHLIIVEVDQYALSCAYCGEETSRRSIKLIPAAHVDDGHWR